MDEYGVSRFSRFYWKPLLSRFSRFFRFYWKVQILLKNKRTPKHRLGFLLLSLSSFFFSTCKLLWIMVGRNGQNGVDNEGTCSAPTTLILANEREGTCTHHASRVLFCYSLIFGADISNYFDKYKFWEDLKYNLRSSQYSYYLNYICTRIKSQNLLT